jgi:hypothetical protein
MFGRRSAGLLLALAVVLGCAAVGAASSPTAPLQRLRRNGLYQAIPSSWNGSRPPPYYYYLRFAGEVGCSVSSTGTPEQVRRWFTCERPGVAKGDLRVEGDAIRLGTRDASGTVRYVIRLHGDGSLEAFTHSEINGYEERVFYRFLPDPG